ncbi:hypothetical protein AJ80_07438 [Polytolypa hystricis UAMH7299]|uniref:Uncharacterized protein n=1 Tax=Polytolypa hystricis (strain UAMH7299) TaxID=1447883 RepID=A0A2B7XPX5_POLH7|nr:hypothetical protein AJ80_07438 [Polytolypa hystricis UAMH7299]
MKFSLSIVAAALLAPLTAAAPAAAAVARQEKAYQIRGVTDPIFHLYLQAIASSENAGATQPILGPEASADTFFIGGTIQSETTGLYLNLEDVDGKSYLRLVFGETGTTTAWGLEGDTIVTVNGSEYGRQLNFVVCAAGNGYYEAYLQTGNDLPPGDCSNYKTLHLPCLC